MQDYRRLMVWQKAHAVTLNTRRVTRSFPRSGYAALRSQIIRAAESIPCNVVEGCFAASQKDFARFIDISIKSTGEVEYQLQLAHDYGVLSHRNWQALTTDTVEVRRMLVGLRRKVLASQRSSSSH